MLPILVLLTRSKEALKSVYLIKGGDSDQAKVADILSSVHHSKYAAPIGCPSSFATPPLSK